jgi:hypothetical protein
MATNTRKARNYTDRCHFGGGSGVRIIMGADETTLRQMWSERQRLAQLDQLSITPRAAQSCDPADLEPFTCPIRVAHAEFMAALKGQPPRAIPLDVDAADLEDRAHHLNKVLNALSVYVTAILDDTRQNIPGRIDFGDVAAGLSDIVSDVTGSIQLAADAMTAGRVA